MSTILDQTANGIANHLRSERETRNWALADLAKKSAVSKAMISKIERGESSPTMNVLARLCGAFGLTISAFLIRAEGQSGKLVRAANQPSWRDPDTGCIRTLVSPTAGGPIEIVSIKLPAGAKVDYPASIYAVFHQVVIVTNGQLSLTEGETRHILETGDCLELGQPSQCVFANNTTNPCLYLVAASRRTEK